MFNVEGVSNLYLDYIFDVALLGFLSLYVSYLGRSHL